MQQGRGECQKACNLYFSPVCGSNGRSEFKKRKNNSKGDRQRDRPRKRKIKREREKEGEK
jgi:hypothetical protein